MRYIAVVLLACFISTSTLAQVDSTPISPPTSGEVNSNMPAATTGTAPIDTTVPSGTGTTGTSGTTMEQAEENNQSNSSFVWLVLAAAALAGLIVLMRKRKRKA